MLCLRAARWPMHLSTLMMHLYLFSWCIYLLWWCIYLLDHSLGRYQMFWVLFRGPHTSSLINRIKRAEFYYWIWIFSYRFASVRFNDLHACMWYRYNDIIRYYISLVRSTMAPRHHDEPRSYYFMFRDYCTLYYVALFWCCILFTSRSWLRKKSFYANSRLVLHIWPKIIDMTVCLCFLCIHRNIYNIVPDFRIPTIIYCNL